MSNITRTIAQLGLILTVLGAVMFVADVGTTDTWNVVAGNDVSPTTEAVFGHCTTDSITGLEVCTGADFTDRLVVTGMTVGLLVGLGVIGVNRNNPVVINNMIRYLPLLMAFIGVTQYLDTVQDILMGDYVYGNKGDAANGMNLAISGWVASAASKFFKN